MNKQKGNRDALVNRAIRHFLFVYFFVYNFIS
jgi:hypothetical protein